jgi:hypothetical protein
MSKQQTTTKSRLASAFGIIGLVTFVILAVGAIALGWSHILLQDLPFIFWALYALFVTSICVVYFNRSDTSTNPIDQPNTKRDPIYRWVSVLNFLFLTFLGISQRDWNGTKLLALTLSALYVLTWGPNLIRALRTRFSPQRATRNR